MSLSPYTVLTAVVGAGDASGDPVPSDVLADSLGVTEADLSDPIDSLCKCELLETTDEGYGPTITAHELLALDIDLGDVLAIDVVEE